MRKKDLLNDFMNLTLFDTLINMEKNIELFSIGQLQHAHSVSNRRRIITSAVALPSSGQHVRDHCT